MPFFSCIILPDILMGFCAGHSYQLIYMAARIWWHGARFTYISRDIASCQPSFSYFIMRLSRYHRISQISRRLVTSAKSHAWKRVNTSYFVFCRFSLYLIHHLISRKSSTGAFSASRRLFYNIFKIINFIYIFIMRCKIIYQTRRRSYLRSRHYVISQPLSMRRAFDTLIYYYVSSFIAH